MNRATPGQLWPQVAPEWMLNLPEGLEDLFYRFYKSLIFDNRYEMYIEGLKNTLILTFFALMIGIVIGVVVAMIRVTWDKNGEEMKGAPKAILSVANAICQVYLTVIRGTPVVVQLLIIYFVIFGAVDVDKVLVAVIAFGINDAMAPVEASFAAAYADAEVKYNEAIAG